MTLVRSGPMITNTNGYPTTSWGSNGYGAQCDSNATCIRHVQQQASRGAGIIKVPVVSPLLPLPVMKAITDEAHRLGLTVAMHATSAAAASLAADAGADVLAHAPYDISSSTIEKWNLRGKALVTTLATFGGVASVSALRQDGLTTICAQPRITLSRDTFLICAYLLQCMGPISETRKPPGFTPQRFSKWLPWECLRERLSCQLQVHLRTTGT
jgi:hypothetical protein